jgi:2-polyprenyl-6-methoxyphenol hydroxylase-like FAD-dependent oxidoreductase
MRVLVVGGGIGGLALGVALARRGIAFEIWSGRAALRRRRRGGSSSAET